VKSREISRYGSCMAKKVPITVTLDSWLRRWAEHLVATGRAPSISAVINDALAESYTRHRQRMLRDRAGHADQARVRRMRAHIESQAASLGLPGDGYARPAD
jgi:Arc/MetJ-type ribon-helix-helix transcriptional regulator